MRHSSSLKIPGTWFWRCSWEQQKNLSHTEYLWVETAPVFASLDHSGRNFNGFDRFSSFECRVQLIRWYNSPQQVATVTDTRKELVKRKIFRFPRFFRFLRCVGARHQNSAIFGRSPTQGNARKRELSTEKTPKSSIKLSPKASDTVKGLCTQRESSSGCC